MMKRVSMSLVCVISYSRICTCQILVECVLYEVCLLYVPYLSRMCTLRERVSMCLVCVISYSRMCTCHILVECVCVCVCTL